MFIVLVTVYRKKLSRRLLFDKSANDDHERLILTKLKQQCGGQFTSKMEGMVSGGVELCCMIEFVFFFFKKNSCGLAL